MFYSDMFHANLHSNVIGRALVGSCTVSKPPSVTPSSDKLLSRLGRNISSNAAGLVM
eukprot:m.25298 g.25298  ORF g.25298 m.25298 type:complete len:57 (-) comp14943_c1_seq1:1240-1410(-)